jgi:hypothetical protein
MQCVCQVSSSHPGCGYGFNRPCLPLPRIFLPGSSTREDGSAVAGMGEDGSRDGKDEAAWDGVSSSREGLSHSIDHIHFSPKAIPAKPTT